MVLIRTTQSDNKLHFDSYAEIFESWETTKQALKYIAFAFNKYEMGVIPPPLSPTETIVTCDVEDLWNLQKPLAAYLVGEAEDIDGSVVFALVVENGTISVELSEEAAKTMGERFVPKRKVFDGLPETTGKSIDVLPTENILFPVLYFLQEIERDVETMA